MLGRFHEMFTITRERVLHIRVGYSTIAISIVNKVLEKTLGLQGLNLEWKRYLFF